MLFNMKFNAICFMLWSTQAVQCYGTKKDQTSPRMNTLSDDEDDLQKQLDNEVRDRLQFARPKTIWVLHFPTHSTQMSSFTKKPLQNPATSTEDYVSKRDFYEHRSTWQQRDGNFMPRDYQDEDYWFKTYTSLRGGKFPSSIAQPTRELVWITARVPLPLNRYQTKPYLSNLRTYRQKGRQSLRTFLRWR